MKNPTRSYCSKWVGRGRYDLKQSAEYGVDEINVDIKRFQNERDKGVAGNMIKDMDSDCCRSVEIADAVAVSQI
ncbi:hypothetical protein GOP47_0012830 [Adiantum capillus-veneris]|uniref:Uncharacterized protein n=1 Tax=Adiantum capillus-veneris TaxID=13818 RepID=A0A9D4URF0_ADICA|nr:hypothetical protein GOP47_0012830 [Adiantum capillus-veneris]